MCPDNYSALNMALIATFIFSSLVSALPLNEDENIAVDLSYLGGRVFAVPDPKIGEKLESWKETSGENPEELGEYAEGDIVFPKTTSRNGLVGNTYHWPNGIVPYEIAGLFSANDLKTINRAMDIYKKYTCINFRPRNRNDKDYISIINTRTGCWASVGRLGGKQEVNLQSSSCTTKVGTALHELMHAIGFLHEHSRYERDDFINIAWKNIKKGNEHNFDKADREKTNGFGVAYDYRSVMHYSNKAFSANGQPTVIPKEKIYIDKIGQRDGFSKGDITKINAMYNCPDKTLALGNSTGTIPNGTTSTDNENEPSTNPLLNAAAGLFSLFIH